MQIGLIWPACFGDNPGTHVPDSTLQETENE